jgi:fatty-acyl-CoA synthase
LRFGASVTPAEIATFVKQRIGSVKTPKQIEIWPDLPRSKVGKVLKKDVKLKLRSSP